jgi:phage/plasmid-like protein (TIGR03299 family)
MAHGLTASDSMFSVRETPWHGLGFVPDKAPESIDQAIEWAGLGWQVNSGDVKITVRPEWVDDFGVTHPAVEIPAITEDGTVYKANLREDTGTLLGIVTEDYKVVQQKDAYKFLDALLGSDLHFETAGSLFGGKRVWVLARVPEWVEIGGDATATYVYVANSHDGTMSVMAAVTPVRIVCNNTLSYALRKSEFSENAARLFKFRHTGDLKVKFDEARKVMGLTINYAEQFKALGDRLAQERMPVDTLVSKVLTPLFPITDDMGKIAKGNRERNRDKIVDLFRGAGEDGDTSGNSPGTAWCAVNAIGEFADWKRRYTKKSNQVARSFEDTDLKQRGLDLVVAAVS